MSQKLLCMWVVWCKYWKQKQQLYRFKNKPLVIWTGFLQEQPEASQTLLLICSSTGSDCAFFFLMLKIRKTKTKKNSSETLPAQICSGSVLVNASLRRGCEQGVAFLSGGTAFSRCADAQMRLLLCCVGAAFSKSEWGTVPESPVRRSISPCN